MRNDGSHSYGGRTIITSWTFTFRRGVLAVLIGGIAASLCVGQPAGRSGSPSSRATRVHPPEWFTNIPPDENRIVARGRGESRDEQIAVDKAVAAARSNLADTVDFRWQELVRATRHEVPDTTGATGGPVTLTGSTLSSQKTVRRGATWYAFVLVGLSKSSLREAVLERLHRDDRWYAKVKDTRAVSTFEQGHR